MQTSTADFRTGLLGDVVKIATPLVQTFEGLARVRADGAIVPYLCPAHYPTQGWGRVVASLDAPPIDRATADLWLFQDILRHAVGVLSASPTLAREPPARVAALTSFAFNLGVAAYRSSTLRRCVDAGLWGDVPAQLGRWVFAAGVRLPGLVRRRAAEAALI